MVNQNNLIFNSDFCEYPVIKAVNGDNAFPPTSAVETNIGDMIIGINDFTIETYIKFDDVNQDHRIINHVETSRNRSAWLLYHRGDRTESSGGSFGDTKGRWFQWLVNNGNADQLRQVIVGLITFHFCHLFSRKTIHGIILH